MAGIQELQNIQKAKVFGLFQKQNKMLKMLHMCESGYQSMSCSVFHLVPEKKYLHTSLSFISPIKSLCLQIVLRTILVCCTDKTVSHRKKKKKFLLISVQPLSSPPVGSKVYLHMGISKSVHNRNQIVNQYCITQDSNDVSLITVYVRIMFDVSFPFHLMMRCKKYKIIVSVYGNQNFKTF